MMIPKVTIKDKECLLGMDPKKIEQYLEANGWSKAEMNYRSGIALGQHYDKTIGDIIHSVMIPVNNKFADYSARMAEVIYELEAAENRSQLEIWADLTGHKVEITKLEE